MAKLLNLLLGVPTKPSVGNLIPRPKVRIKKTNLKIKAFKMLKW